MVFFLFYFLVRKSYHARIRHEEIGKKFETNRSQYYIRYWMCYGHHCSANEKNKKFENWDEICYHMLWHARCTLGRGSRCHRCMIYVKDGHIFSNRIKHFNDKHLKECIKCKTCRCVFRSVPEYELLHLKKAVAGKCHVMTD